MGENEWEKNNGNINAQRQVVTRSKEPEHESMTRVMGNSMKSFIDKQKLLLEKDDFDNYSDYEEKKNKYKQAVIRK